MKKISIITHLLIVTNLFAASTHLPLTINGDITYSDTLFLDTTCTISDGAVVNLSPGTNVISTSKRSAILVDDGALMSLGSENNPVSFSRVDSIDSYPGIIINKPESSTTPYSKFKYTNINNMIAGINIMGVEGEELYFSISNCVFDSCEMYSLFSIYATLVVDSCQFYHGAPETLSTDPSFYISTLSSDLEVSNSKFNDSRGGAIKVEKGSLKLTSSEFDIQAEIAIGASGVYTSQTSDTVLIRDCKFTNPEGADTSSWAGALYIFSPYGQVLVESSEFRDTYGNWGAVKIEHGDNVILKDLTFDNNFSRTEGGALDLYEITHLSLTNTEFSKNYSQSLGGALLLDKVDTATLYGLSFFQNSSSKGGAVCFKYSNSTLLNSTFDNNKNSIHCEYNGRTILENLLITNDSSSAISMDLVYDTLLVNNITAANNYRDIFAGTYSYSRFNNSIFWNSEADFLSDQSVGASVLFDKCWGDDDGEGDPLFVNESAGDYGLLEESPCVDNGDSTYCVSTHDLINNIRVYGSNVDMGAYEYGSHTSSQLQTVKKSDDPIIIRENRLTINFIDNNAVTIRLYNLSGRVLWNSETAGTQNTFILPENLAKGVYVISVESAFKRINYPYLKK